MSTPRKLTVAGLFAGIGGFERGLADAGHASALFSEIDPGANAVLEARFSDVPIQRDVRTLDAIPRNIDLVAAGFPCQDLSQAGRTRGIEGAQSGLVHEVLRMLRKRPVPLVLLENVPFMLRLAKGRALDVIVTAFEELGYKWAYRVIDSRAFGLPQRRERVFFLAALDEDPRNVLLADEEKAPRPHATWTERACGFYWTEGIRGLGWAIDAVPTLKGGSSIGVPSPPAIVLPGGRVVRPDIRDAERLQGFPADWTLPAESVVKRGMRWKLIGNAVNVRAAAWIGARLARPGVHRSPDGARRLDPGAPWPRAAWNVGAGRHAQDASPYPVHIESARLDAFLEFPPEALSARATSGFLARTRRASLVFPPGFIRTVEAHLERVRGDDATVVR